jgi:hypothetical protein
MKHDAQKILQDLQQKLSEVETLQKLLACERTSLAYDALTGDAKAKKRLDGINADLAVIDQEIASVQAAIAEAGRRVAEAEAQARAEVDAEKRKRALVIADKITEHAKQLDDHAALFFGLYAAFRLDMIELHRLGAAPNINVIDAVCLRALETASMGTRLQLRHLAPGDRVSFAELANSWKQNTEAWAHNEPNVTPMPSIGARRKVA